MNRGSIDFYNELHKIHNEAFPDWRFSQLVCNLMDWYGRDPFYLEDDKIIVILKKYANANSVMKKYPEVEE